MPDTDDIHGAITDIYKKAGPDDFDNAITDVHRKADPDDIHRAITESQERGNAAVPQRIESDRMTCGECGRKGCEHLLRAELVEVYRRFTDLAASSVDVLEDRARLRNMYDSLTTNVR